MAYCSHNLLPATCDNFLQGVAMAALASSALREAYDGFHSKPLIRPCNATVTSIVTPAAPHLTAVVKTDVAYVQGTGGDYVGLTGPYMTYVTNTITTASVKGTYQLFHDQVKLCDMILICDRPLQHYQCACQMCSRRQKSVLLFTSCNLATAQCVKGIGNAKSTHNC